MASQLETVRPTTERPQPETVPPPARRSRRRTLLYAAIAILLVAVAGFWLYYHNRESTDDAEIEGHIQPVSPRVSGTVIEVDVNDNQLVHAGNVLFKLDPRDYQVALARAQADVDAARAAAQGARVNVPITQTSSGSQLTSAEAGAQEAQAGVDAARHQLDLAQAQAAAARAALAQAQANAQRAIADEKRYAALVAKDEVSQQQYETVATGATAARANVDAAQAQVNAADQSVAAARSGILIAQSKAAQAEATVRSAQTAPEQLSVTRAQASNALARLAQFEAALKQAQLNMDYTVIRSPVDGLVGNKHVEVGQTFAQGQVALDIVPVNDVWVTADFKETQLRRMRPGQKAAVSVDAYSASLRAHVDSIGAATGSRFSLLPPENATGNYVKVVQRVPVKLVFESGQDLSRLRPGMSVEATVFTK
jgi:membrane fusion protein (multidrug efflux system)